MEVDLEKVRLIAENDEDRRHLSELKPGEVLRLQGISRSGDTTQRITFIR